MFSSTSNNGIALDCCVDEMWKNAGQESCNVWEMILVGKVAHRQKGVAPPSYSFSSNWVSKS